jgi:phosphoglycerol geranylgeranyltransferase
VNGPVLTGVYSLITEGLERGPLHVTLIDPERQEPEKAAVMAADARTGGTDILLVGGTTGVDAVKMDRTIEAIRELCDLPVVIFPASSVSLSPRADAILFMSLMNSRSVKYVNGEAVMGSFMIRQMGLEAIPTGYVVVDPGMTVGEVGEVSLVSRNDCKSASCYALAAQYFGMKLFYMEGGSGVKDPIPNEMISEVRSVIDIPLVVGGGISNPKRAEEAVKAGADIIVTGTLVEKERDIPSSVRELRKAMTRGWRDRI